jgi:D-sedoheptulose 7-phosphate isomerase
MALTDNMPLVTAWANDSSYEEIFSEQLKNFARQGDLALALSCTGKSPNVLLGLKTARELGLFTAGLAGFQGGAMSALCDVCAVVPCDNLQLTEDLHQAILHSMCSAVRECLQDRPDALRRAAGQ